MFHVLELSNWTRLLIFASPERLLNGAFRKWRVVREVKTVLSKKMYFRASTFPCKFDSAVKLADLVVMIQKAKFPKIHLDANLSQIFMFFVLFVPISRDKNVAKTQIFAQMVALESDALINR